MNLVVNRQLDRTQKQVIYELTLKKRQSKKSTMSEKQVLALQQLAKELTHERKIPHLEGQINNLITSNCTSCNTSSIIEAASDNSSISASALTFNTDDHNSINCDDQHNSSPTNTTGSVCNSFPGSIHKSSHNCNGCCTTNRNHHQVKQQNQTNTTVKCCSNCSFSRSDSSYSGSSQDSGAQMIVEREDLNQEEINELQGRKKEANIKFNKIRLEHLNSELDKRLQQYEYLVAQEKALLRSFNIMLFTNEGVNNFHLHDALVNPNRRVQKQLQQNKINAHKNSNGLTYSNNTIAASNLNLTTASSKDKQPEPLKKTNSSSSRPHLNSSASTVSNLNNLHMLPPVFSKPRRSASSVALVTITQR